MDKKYIYTEMFETQYRTENIDDKIQDILSGFDEMIEEDLYFGYRNVWLGIIEKSSGFFGWKTVQLLNFSILSCGVAEINTTEKHLELALRLKSYFEKNGILTIVLLL